MYCTSIAVVWVLQILWSLASQTGQGGVDAAIPQGSVAPVLQRTVQTSISVQGAGCGAVPVSIGASVGLLRHAFCRRARGGRVSRQESLNLITHLMRATQSETSVIPSHAKQKVFQYFLTKRSVNARRITLVVLMWLLSFHVELVFSCAWNWCDGVTRHDVTLTQYWHFTLSLTPVVISRWNN